MQQDSSTESRSQDLDTSDKKPVDEHVHTERLETDTEKSIAGNKLASSSTTADGRGPVVHEKVRARVISSELGIT